MVISAITSGSFAGAKPTKEELITTAKITAAVTVATAVVSLAVQAVLRNR